MTTEKYEMDERGVSKNNPAAPGWEPTTRFHPNELPSNPVARAMVPKELISEDDEWTSSPMGDNHPELRQKRAEKSYEEEQEKIDQQQEELTEIQAQAKELSGSKRGSKTKSSDSASTASSS